MTCFRKIAPTIVAMILLASPVSADSFQESLVNQLGKQGYREIMISRTFLGRTRIVAISTSARREIIFNARTGEILRDFWKLVGADTSEGGQLLMMPGDNSGLGSGNSGRDDHGGSDDHD